MWLTPAEGFLRSIKGVEFMAKSQTLQNDAVIVWALVASAAACLASTVTVVTSFVMMRRAYGLAGNPAATDYRPRSILDVTRAAPVRHAAAVPPENPHSPPTPPLGSPQVRR